MGFFFGTVVRYDSTECKYEVQYDDGDFAKLTELEILSSLMPNDQNEISTMPLSDRTNRIYNDNIVPKRTKKCTTNMRIIKENVSQKDVDTSSAKMFPPSLLPPVPPPQLNTTNRADVVVVPPPTHELSSSSSPSSCKRKNPVEDKEEEEMMTMMMQNSSSNLAELRPDGEFRRHHHAVPMAEVVDEDSSTRSSSTTQHRRHRHAGKSRSQGEACVCTISGCVVM